MSHIAIFGLHSVTEIVKSRPQDVFQVVLVKNKSSKKLDELIHLSQEFHVPIVQKSKDEWYKWAKQHGPDSLETMTHQEVGCEVQKRKEVSLELLMESVLKQDKFGLLVALDEIQDPHNVGAIIRVSACAGAHGVIFSKRGAPISATVEKVSAGGTEHVDLCGVSNIQYALTNIKQENFFIVGLDANATSTIYDIPTDQHLTIVIGNEERGLRPVIRDQCDMIVQIPMPGKMDSLNASVASGITLFEIIRQRLHK